MSRLRVVTFKADSVLVEELDRVSKILGVGRSELIRCALHELLSRDPRVLRKMFMPRYSWLAGSIGFHDIICIDLTADEMLRLKKINDDPVRAIKHLIEVIPLA